MKTHRSLRCLVTAVALIVGCCYPSPGLAARDTEVVRQSPEKAREKARDALEILLRGDPASRREAVEDVGSIFQFLNGIPCQDTTFREILGALERILRTERDDWIASRLLQNLGDLDTDCLNPLYLQALKSRSPNVLWRAIQWFANHEDPEAVPYLEHAWRLEKRPWVRIDLLGALAENPAPGLASDLLDVAERGSPSLSRAAFEAIQTLGDPGTIPDLARLAREGKGPVRAEAVTTLTAWPDSDEALTAVLDATGDRELEARERAIEALGQFPGPRAAQRALDLAGSGNPPADRSAALRALEKLRSPEAIPVLTDLLHESFPEESSNLPAGAIRLLSELDDPAAVPLLQDLDPEMDDTGPLSVQTLIESLARDRTTEAGRISWIRLSCGGDFLEDDPENPVDFVIVPPDGRLTIRCWEFPGVAGDPEDFERIPGGIWAHVEDHFEGEDDSWVQIESSEDCWVPRRLLEPRSGEDDPGEPAETPGRKEFDLQEDELLSETASRLMDAGLLKVIEPGEAIVGVSLEVEPGDEEGLALLQRSCGNDDSLLDWEIEKLLKALRRTCPGLCDPSSTDDPDCPGEEDPTAVLIDD